MIIRVRHNPIDCVELSAFLGYHVNRWDKKPDGSMEIDIDTDGLTPGEKVVLIKKLEEVQNHLVEVEEED